MVVQVSNSSPKGSKEPLRTGQVIEEGELFSEPMRIESLQLESPYIWTIGLVGIRTERFRKVRLTGEQISSLTIRSTTPTFSGDASLLRLGLQAYSLGVAFEYQSIFRPIYFKS